MICEKVFTGISQKTPWNFFLKKSLAGISEEIPKILMKFLEIKMYPQNNSHQGFLKERLKKFLKKSLVCRIPVETLECTFE